MSLKSAYKSGSTRHLYEFEPVEEAATDAASPVSPEDTRRGQLP